jgi:hypothetical protein
MANRAGTRWLVDAEYSTPEQNLMAAVVHKAIRDAQHGRDTIRTDALAYLHGPNFEADCAWLNLDPARVRSRLVEEKQPAPEPESSSLTDDQVRAIHARYVQDRTLDLRALARQYHTTAATLSRRFARLQLAARGRGNPNMTIVPQRRGRPRRRSEAQPQ